MIPGPGGWHLSPEGAAIHFAERTAVVADVHLGYEWARGANGDCVPPHSLAETLRKLAAMLDRAPVDRLIVAGDLVESPGPCPRTAADVRALAAWLAGRGVAFVPMRGNHDPRRIVLPTRIEVAGWTIAHGDRPLTAERTITGHLHPALRVDGLNAPCFLVGPSTILLPAFSPNAAGLDVLSTPPPWPVGESPRCIAGLDGAILDFGPLDALAARLRPDRRPAELARKSARRLRIKRSSANPE